MARYSQPKGVKYKAASTFDLSKQTGRAQLWHERLRRAKRMLKHNELKAECRDYSQYLDGTKGLVSRGEDVYLNEALPAIEDVIFGTIPRIPPVTVESRQLEQEKLANRCAALIDATMGGPLMGLLDTMIALEWDEFNYGIAVGRMGWEQDERTWTEREVNDPEYRAAHQAKAEEENEDPEHALMADEDEHLIHIPIHEQAHAIMPPGPERDALGSHIILHWARLGTRTWAHPSTNRVDPLRFLYDPDAEVWEDRRWEAEECDEFVFNLQQIPGIRQANLNPQNCPPIDEFDNREPEERLTEEWDYENRRVKVHKIHDRINDQYIILPAKESSECKPLLEADWPYGSLEIYNIIVHRPKPGSIAGYVPMKLTKPILVELAKTNAVIRKHNRRAANYGLIAARGALDKRDKRAIESERLIKEVDPAAVATMKEFRPPALPKELLDYREMLLAELRRLLGSDIMHHGGDTPHQISATEAGLRGGYQQARYTRRQQKISDFLSWVARNVILMYRDFADDEIPVRVAGSEGIVVEWLNPAAIPGDLEVTLDIEAVTETRQQEDAIAADNFVQRVTQIAPGMYDPVELLMFYGERQRVRNAQRFFVKPEELGGMEQVPGMPGQPAQSKANVTQGPQPKPRAPQPQIA